jgi:hypothetical protein
MPQELSEKVEYNADNLRDPFLSWIPKEEMSTGTQISEADLGEYTQLPSVGSLQGIIYGKTKIPQVIINNNVFGIGDFLDEGKELKITDINKDGIKILYRGKTFFKSSNELSVQVEEK